MAQWVFICTYRALLCRLLQQIMAVTMLLDDADNGVGVGDGGVDDDDSGGGGDGSVDDDDSGDGGGGRGDGYDENDDDDDDDGGGGDDDDDDDDDDDVTTTTSVKDNCNVEEKWLFRSATACLNHELATGLKESFSSAKL